MRLRHVASVSVFCVCGSAWAPAHAQQSSNSTGSAAVEIVLPSAFQNLGNLDFADIIVTTAGTATINPNSDAMTVSGGLLSAGGTPKASLFQIRPSKRGAIFIQIPTAPSTLTRMSGTETVTVSNWTISSNAQSVGGGRYKVVAANDPIPFKIGGTLNVPANPVAGTYVGTFDVTVDNP
jgi:hypothetical protein